MPLPPKSLSLGTPWFLKHKQPLCQYEDCKQIAAFELLDLHEHRMFVCKQHQDINFMNWIEQGEPKKMETPPASG